MSAKSDTAAETAATTQDAQTGNEKKNWFSANFVVHATVVTGEGEKHVAGMFDLVQGSSTAKLTGTKAEVQLAALRKCYDALAARLGGFSDVNGFEKIGPVRKYATTNGHVYIAAITHPDKQNGVTGFLTAQSPKWGNNIPRPVGRRAETVEFDIDAF